MTELNFYSLLFLITDGLFIGLILLAMFHYRKKLGINIIYITLGVFQHMQAALASFIYFEIFPNVFVSPGSSVLFTASLFMVLLVYIREDASEARKLIYGVVLANIILSVFTVLIGAQLDWLSAIGANSDNFAYFTTHPRVLLAGTATLVVDLLLIIIAFEFFSNYVSIMFIRICSAMMLVLVVDSVLFSIGSFYGQDQLFAIMQAGVTGKLLMALVFSVLLACYIKVFQRKEYSSSIKGSNTKDIYTFLTYRQKYEILKKEVAFDSLTGLYNRGHLDATLPKEFDLAIERGLPLAFLMIDIDNFKQINDQFGHPVGDQFIKLVSSVIERASRQIDIACRYGGEEFAIILPYTDMEEAKIFAQRIQTSLAQEFETNDADLPCAATLTIGIAVRLVDQRSDEYSVAKVAATSARQLIDIADHRLYLGKKAGRNCIIWSNN